jgi:ParB-like chromosome segregation protein Spo0J
MKLIKLHDVKTSNIQIKEHNISANAKLIKSLQKYGQIYPILINKKNEIIKGENVFKAMKELNYETIYVNVLDIEHKVEMFHIKKLLYETQDNLDILKLSILISEFKEKYSIDQLSEITGINVYELINYVDLLKLDNLIKEKHQEKQIIIEF